MNYFNFFSRNSLECIALLVSKQLKLGTYFKYTMNFSLLIFAHQMEVVVSMYIVPSVSKKNTIIHKGNIFKGIFLHKFHYHCVASYHLADDNNS